MEQLRKILASGPSYVGLYILFMIPTYILPYFGSNSFVANATLAAIDEAAGGGNGLNLLLYVHLVSLGALALIAWLRGSEIGKVWIVTFPIIAGVFDIMPGLSMIPLVPTAMHIGAIIMGVSTSRQA